MDSPIKYWSVFMVLVVLVLALLCALASCTTVQALFTTTTVVTTPTSTNSSSTTTIKIDDRIEQAEGYDQDAKTLPYPTRLPEGLIVERVLDVSENGWSLMVIYQGQPLAVVAIAMMGEDTVRFNTPFGDVFVAVGPVDATDPEQYSWLRNELLSQIQYQY